MVMCLKPGRSEFMGYFYLVVLPVFLSAWCVLCFIQAEDFYSPVSLRPELSEDDHLSLIYRRKSFLNVDMATEVKRTFHVSSWKQTCPWNKLSKNPPSEQPNATTLKFTHPQNRGHHGHSHVFLYTDLCRRQTPSDSLSPALVTLTAENGFEMRIDDEP